MGLFDFWKPKVKADEINKMESNTLDTKNDETEEIDSDNKVKKFTDTNDGSESRLGYGFATSKALNYRGFRDGSSNPSNTGLQNTLELLVGEYSAFIQSKIDELDDEYMAARQWQARSHGISVAYDNKLETLFDTIEAKKQERKLELEKIQNNEGYIRHIQIAYKNGYTNALEKQGSYEYIPIQKSGDK